MSALLIFPCIGLFLTAIWLTFRRSARSTLPLPPGPRRYPIIGSFLEIPTIRPWNKYAEWAEEYRTDILCIKAFRQPYIILSSLDSVNELLNRRSALTSSRPFSMMLHKLMGWEWNLALAPYGEGWRARRRVFWQEFNLSSLRSSPYKPIQLKHARRFLRRLFESPDKFIEHTHYAPASTILEATYGLDIALYDDKLIDLISTTVHHFEKIMGFGTVWVDAFPWLQHLPKWFPGAGFRRVADAAHRDTMKMIEIPYAEAVQQYNAEQTSAPQSSVVSRSLLRLNAGSDSLTSTPEQDKLVKDVAAMAYIGGADTTEAPLLTLFAAMALYPDIQRKAQEEIDAVIMHDEHRLPAFDDIPHLLYCQAMVWELLRWQPFIPMGIVHLSTSEDVFRGYRIPKGSLISCNVWSIMHDPALFPEPERFMPERFIRKLDHGIQCELNKDLINIVTMSFGFGRRVCPGRAFALDSLQITLVSILFAFDISPAKDASGKDVLPELELEPLLVSRLRPFKCSITPRSTQVVDLIVGNEKS